MQEAGKLPILKHLSKLLTLTMDMLKGPPSLQFSALATMNRILDFCIIHKVYHPWQFEDSSSSSSQHPIRRQQSNASTDTNNQQAKVTSVMNTVLPPVNPIHAHFETLIRGSPKLAARGGSPKSRSTSWKSTKSSSSATTKDSPRLGRPAVAPEASSRETSFMEEPDLLSCCDNTEQRTPLEVLLGSDPQPLMSTLQNSIVMHKQTMGTRHKCSPSVRWRHCTYHCLQILSARALALMCHGSTGQHKVVNDGHIKTFVEALDPNHDPVSNDSFINPVRMLNHDLSFETRILKFYNWYKWVLYIVFISYFTYYLECPCISQNISWNLSKAIKVFNDFV